MGEPRRPGRDPLNADPFIQLRLLDVQALDLRLDQLAHRRRTVPEVSEGERLRAERAKLASELATAQAQVSDLTREQRKAEADVEQVRTRRARDEQRLQSGQVGSARDLQSLQSEIESLQRRQSDLEDVELDVMERLEAATAHEQELSARETELGTKLAEVDQARDRAYAEIDAEVDRLRRERTDTAAGVSDDLLRLYEKRRAQHGGVGAAALRQRRCEGCRMELDARYLGQIAAKPDDAVLSCEECGRILIRTLESGV
ncbi:zinc ribbon domain-containing protein [Actinopolymorpha singaporensis]|uniref:Uncharacterized protein n=1 Tax=Actinopolymorpha singaporensis TaxID=117157 RepID=A0A1H1W711_9ACTN|nr:C4-type zinc ribbon domain-containing protein [Actinopolymorpha singaporensis]SDS92510.1 hypothetical protein SAMN04489717_4369 [Actinopolymorpha singaporensis]